MISLFHDMTAVHDEDHVCLPDRREPVGDDEACSSFHHARKCRLNFDFRTGIDTGCRLIEDQHRGEMQHDACDAEELLLSLADVSAILRDDRVVAVRKPADKAVRMRGLCRCDDLLVGGIGLSVTDIFPDRTGFQPDILEDHPVAAPQRMPGHVADIRSGDPDGSVFHIVEAHQQIDERRLSAACRADDRYPPAR